MQFPWMSAWSRPFDMFLYSSALVLQQVLKMLLVLPFLQSPDQKCKGSRAWIATCLTELWNVEFVRAFNQNVAEHLAEGKERRKLLKWKMNRSSSLCLTNSCVSVIPPAFYLLFSTQQINRIQQKTDSSLSFLKIYCAWYFVIVLHNSDSLGPSFNWLGDALSPFLYFCMFYLQLLPLC